MQLEERDGALLYPHEEIVYQGEGWSVIVSNVELAYASHKVCTSERYKYGFASYINRNRTHERESCQYCYDLVPPGIVALVKLLDEDNSEEVVI